MKVRKLSFHEIKNRYPIRDRVFYTISSALIIFIVFLSLILILSFQAKFLYPIGIALNLFGIIVSLRANYHQNFIEKINDLYEDNDIIPSNHSKMIIDNPDTRLFSMENYYKCLNSIKLGNFCILLGSLIQLFEWFVSNISFP